MKKKKLKILLTGHAGLVGSAIYRRLRQKGFKNILTFHKKELDLRDQKKTLNIFLKYKPQAVINAAAKVGGILANDTFRAEFIYDNLMIQNNVINSAYKSGVKNLIFLGSSCVYPKYSKQPIKEEYLLSGKLEYTNEPYAVAKIAGIKLCENYNKQYKTNYKCLMPTNTYGPNDNYDLNNSHFLPALIKKIYLAKKNKKNFVEIWGTGKPKRELIYVDDLADACIFFLFKNTNEALINIGTKEEKSILSYTKIVMKKFDLKLKFKFKGKISDGTPRKKLNSNIAYKYGWKPKIKLNKGIEITIDDFIKKMSNKY